MKRPARFAETRGGRGRSSVNGTVDAADVVGIKRRYVTAGGRGICCAVRPPGREEGFHWYRAVGSGVRAEGMRGCNEPATVFTEREGEKQAVK